jgi:signal transduction histidine kinase
MGDLHDGLCLHLVKALRQARNAKVSPAAVAATLQDCLDDLRVAVDSLDAHERDPLALLGSLRFRMAPRFESFGLRLDCVDPELGELPDLQADAALDLLRIVQEALTNALKHSGARHIVMALRRGPAGGPVVEVPDDGRGFDLAAPARGRGLAQMRLRAARLGATIEWENGPNGTGMRLSFRPWA